MKQIFKCEYCPKMGTKEEILEHEKNCFKNYNKKDCHTCGNCKIGKHWYECRLEHDIPSGKVYIYCDDYVRNEEEQAFSTVLNALFEDLT